jgi:capsular exopolysaccharide synthesis family protein
LAGLLLTLPQTPMYQAKACLEVLPLNENFLNMRDVNPTASEPSYTPEYEIQTQVNVLQSYSTLERVVARIHISDRSLPAEARLSDLKTALRTTPTVENKKELALAAAQRNLRVRARPNTRLVEIRYNSSDPAYAADFANALAAEIIERNLQTRWESAQHTSDWLTRQMLDLKKKLEASEERVQGYARAVGLTFMGEKDNLAEQKLRQVQDELGRAQTDRISKQSSYELAMSASIEALPEVLDDPGLKEYQAKLTELRRELAQLSSSFTGAFPRVKKVEAEITEIQSARDAARMNILARIRNEYDAAQRRERLLAADYEKQLKLVSSQSAAVSRYNILKGEADTERQLYESMLQRVKEAGLASALRASNIHVIDAAQVPKAPYKPNAVLNTALGLLSGAVFGFGYVVVRTRSDRRIREPGDTPVYLETSELGVIPSARSDRYVGTKRMPKLVSLSTECQSGASVPNHPELRFWSREPSALAESFRSILTSLLFSGHNGDRPRVIVLSSPNPAEGKTLVVSNLAIALARVRMRVLVIDGDLRKPRMHDIFGIDNNYGLSDALIDGSQEPVNVNVRETSVPGLLLLTSGTSADTNLLYSGRLPGLMAELRRAFDMILIDTPPMLYMPDARVLARYADAVVLVVRSRQTTKDSALLARQRFAEDGTTILGTVLNDWNPNSSDAYGYEKYNDHYRHYQHRKV